MKVNILGFCISNLFLIDQALFIYLFFFFFQEMIRHINCEHHAFSFFFWEREKSRGEEKKVVGEESGYPSPYWNVFKIKEEGNN